jgi:hypothetical protein
MGNLGLLLSSSANPNLILVTSPVCSVPFRSCPVIECTHTHGLVITQYHTSISPSFFPCSEIAFPRKFHTASAGKEIKVLLARAHRFYLKQSQAGFIKAPLFLQRVSRCHCCGQKKKHSASSQWHFLSPEELSQTSLLGTAEGHACPQEKNTENNLPFH